MLIDIQQAQVRYIAIKMWLSESTESAQCECHSEDQQLTKLYGCSGCDAALTKLQYSPISNTVIIHAVTDRKRPTVLHSYKFVPFITTHYKRKHRVAIMQTTVLITNMPNCSVQAKLANDKTRLNALFVCPLCKRPALTLYRHIKTAEQRTIPQQHGDWCTGC